MSSTKYSGEESGAGLEFANSQRRLVDFRPGDRLDGDVFAIYDIQSRTAKNGNPFLAFRLRDSTGERSARWFTPPENMLEELNSTQLVRVRGFVESQEKFRGDLKIEECRPVEAPEDLSPFLMPLPADHKGHRARFFEMIRAVKAPPLRALLKEIFHLDGKL